MNDQYRAIRGLRATRNYTRQTIDAESLDAIVDAARWTGSSKNNQEWQFVIVDHEEGRRRLAATGRFARAIENAPVTIALVKLPGGYDFDIGRAAQNIMLAAQALGIASCPITLHDKDAAAGVLGLPAGHEAHYAVALGYADEAAEDAERKQRRADGWGGRRGDVVAHLDV